MRYAIVMHAYKMETRECTFPQVLRIPPSLVVPYVLSLSFSFIFAMRSTAALFAVSALVSSALGATYNLKDTFVGEGFLSGFTHQAIPDPTHGRV